MKHTVCQNLQSIKVDQQLSKEVDKSQDHQFLQLSVKHCRAEKSQLKLWAIPSDGSTSLLICLPSSLTPQWKHERCTVRTRHQCKDYLKRTLIKGSANCICDGRQSLVSLHLGYVTSAPIFSPDWGGGAVTKINSFPYLRLSSVT